MCPHLELDIDSEKISSIPKYKRVIWEFKNKIEKGLISYGQRLPSINDLSEDYHLSRNTVEKAYFLLKKEGIIEAVKGKGYFVKNINPLSKVKVMLLFNKLTDYRRVIYSTIVDELSGIADIYLHVYHTDFLIFERLLTENLQKYNYYVVMPHFHGEERGKVKQCLEKIPKENLILLDRKLEYYQGYLGVVYQDFANDINDILQENFSLVSKYKRITLIFPDDVSFSYLKGISSGFIKFCTRNKFECEIISEITDDFELREGDAIITIADYDLVKVIKLVKSSDFELGKNLGILSYHDTLLKEVLLQGITVITPDFGEMGRKVALMIKEKKGYTIRNAFKLIKRNSF